MDASDLEEKFPPPVRQPNSLDKFARMSIAFPAAPRPKGDDIRPATDYARLRAAHRRPPGRVRHLDAFPGSFAVHIFVLHLRRSGIGWRDSATTFPKGKTVMSISRLGVAAAFAVATTLGAAGTALASHGRGPGHDGPTVYGFVRSTQLADSQEKTPDHGMMRDRSMMEGEDGAAAASTMRQGGLLMPMMDPARGRKVFAAKGCVVCHQLNGVGGDHGPSLDMSKMGPMNPFEFAAKMWRGAATMVALQDEELGGQIELTGQDLADIIAFVHSPGEIAKFSEHDLPHQVLDILKRTHGEEPHDAEGKHAHE